MKPLGSIVSIVLALSAAPVMAADIVQPDRVLIGTEYIPRRLDLQSKLVVSAGQTVELAADSAFDYIEVSGTLRVSRTHSTRLQFVHLIVLPGGTLDVGTQSDPIPCGVSVLFTVRNVPIDTTIDPYQWGNGLVNFGHESRVGCAKTNFVEAAGSIARGATSIDLASAPAGWRPGDELLIPDTAEPSVVVATTGAGNVYASRRETTVTIASISGTTVTLSKPLDFEHNVITRPDTGAVLLRPRVANLQRNIVLMSENQFGTRGHTADIGATATWDLGYNALLGLGRTLAEPLDNTDLTASPAHIGHNQIAKYASHFHHVGSSPTSRIVGMVWRGNPNTAKWALSVHDTSDVLVADNIAVDFPGAGLVTEDGDEVRNVFRHNLTAYAATSTPSNLQDAFGVVGDNDVRLNCPGCEGSGFWWHGVMNTFDGNEGWNSFRGLNLFDQQLPAGATYPSRPGGPKDTVADPHRLVPIAMTNNVAASNVVDGLELWTVAAFPNVNLTSAMNRALQTIAVQSDGIGNAYVNPTIVCPPGATAGSPYPMGIHSELGYVTDLTIDGGYIGNCAIGVHGGGSGKQQALTNLTLHNMVNIDALSPGPNVFTNVMHVPLARFPHVYLRMDDHNLDTVGDPGYVWPGTGNLPTVGSASEFVPQRGSRIEVHNWQGTGQDYRLFFNQQLGTNPAWPVGPFKYMFDTPVNGLTMQQSWNQFGISYGGDVLDPTQAITLDGVLYGKARAGLGVPFGPPRAIVTFPTMAAPALGPDDRDPVNTGYVRVYAMLTGNPDPSQASSVMWYSVDGDPPYAWGSKGETPLRQDDRTFNTPHAEPGIHTVDVWRTRPDGLTELPGSRYRSQYFVGDVVTTTIMVPDVVGDSQTTAANVLIANGLRIGTINSANSTAVPAGLIMIQSPAAGSLANSGSAVNLTISLGASTTPTPTPPPPPTPTPPPTPPPPTGPGAVTLGSSSFHAGSGEANWTLTITATPTTTWTAVSDSTWVVVKSTSPSPAAGSGSVKLRAVANCTAAKRTGHILINTALYTVTQGAGPASTCTSPTPTPAPTPSPGPAPNPGAVTLAAVSFHSGSGESNWTLNVAAASTTTWTAVSDSSWLVVKSTVPSPAIGNGAVKLRALSNCTTSKRVGHISINGSVYAVTQGAGPASGCAP